MKIRKICFYIFLTLLIISCESTKKESSTRYPSPSDDRTPAYILFFSSDETFNR
ncbi:MAG: hypothetical protein ACJ0O5_05195 [Flavobacteriaceae bacterium]